MARQIKKPFPESTITTSKSFEVLNGDLWGPYHIETDDGYNYFFTIVDDNSRSIMTQILESGSQPAFMTLQRS